jgi:hypothetical protein
MGLMMSWVLVLLLLLHLTHVLTQLVAPPTMTWTVAQGSICSVACNHGCQVPFKLIQSSATRTRSSNGRHVQQPMQQFGCSVMLTWRHISSISSLQCTIPSR